MSRNSHKFNYIYNPSDSSHDSDNSNNSNDIFLTNNNNKKRERNFTKTNKNKKKKLDSSDDDHDDYELVSSDEEMLVKSLLNDANKVGMQDRITGKKRKLESYEGTRKMSRSGGSGKIKKVLRK